MNVQKRNNNVSIYRLSAGATIPEWLGDQGRRNLAKRDENVRRRIELIQDFEMPASSSKLVTSLDGRYVFAAGVYPPRIKCYDLYEFGLKFERRVDATVVDMCMLGQDYGKLAILMDDRTIALHAPYGSHTSIRVPTFGRALAYESTTCELLVAARGSRVYRLDLEEGRFGEPWNMSSSNDNNTNSNSSASLSSNCIAVHPCHALASVGCNDGSVQMWDSRTPDTLKSFLSLDVATAVAGYGYAETSNNNNNNNSSSFVTRHPTEVTSIAYDNSGLYMAAGTYGGVVALYDIRSSRPLHIQEHKQGWPIHTLRFHATSQMILSADEKLIKCWRYKPGSYQGGNANINDTFDDPTISSSSDHNDKDLSTSVGSTLVNIEGNGSKIQNFVIAGDNHDTTGDASGLILCATDQPKMDSFFVPALGVAPRWCSYLENITEELEERDLQRGDNVKDGQESIYENYKFVTREDLESLGVSNLIGTPLLRGYMHGFFMDTNLYNRVKAVANPFEYEEYKKKKLQERMAAKRTSRITQRVDDKKTTTTAVNPELAEHLERKSNRTKNNASAKVAGNLLQDDRFGGLFTNPDFTIDKDAEDFKLRNPSGIAANKLRKEKFDSDDEDEAADSQNSDNDDDNGIDGDNIDEQSESDHDDESAGSDSDSDADEIGYKVRGEAYEEMKELEKRLKQQQKSTKPNKKSANKDHNNKMGSNKMRLVSATNDKDDMVNIGLGGKAAKDKAQQRQEQMQKPLSERLLEQDEGGKYTRKTVIRGTGGNKEMSFTVQDKSKREKGAGNSSSSQVRGNKRQRRGVKDLKLKKQH